MGPLEGVKVVEFAGIGPAPIVGMCSGQLIPDSILRFSSAVTGETPSLNA